MRGNRPETGAATNGSSVDDNNGGLTFTDTAVNRSSQMKQPLRSDSRGNLVDGALTLRENSGTVVDQPAD